MARKYRSLSKSQLDQLAQNVGNDQGSEEYREVVNELTRRRASDRIKAPTKKESIAIFVLFFGLSVLSIYIGYFPLWIENIDMREEPIWFWSTLLLLNGISLGRLYLSFKEPLPGK